MKFDYGDEALFSHSSDATKPRVESWLIVGITPVNNEELAGASSVAIGTTLYTVEFGDGSDALVAEEKLTLVEPSDTIQKRFPTFAVPTGTPAMDSEKIEDFIDEEGIF
jgi:hypothetical protein